MKSLNRTMDKIAIACGILFLFAAAVVAIYFKQFDARVPLIIGLTVIAVAGISLYKTKGGMPEENERIRKLKAFSLAFSWKITLVLVAVFLLLDCYNVFRLESFQLGTVIIFSMYGSVVLAYIYLWKRGDML